VAKIVLAALAAGKKFFMGWPVLTPLVISERVSEKAVAGPPRDPGYLVRNWNFPRLATT